MKQKPQTTTNLLHALLLLLALLLVLPILIFAGSRLLRIVLPETVSDTLDFAPTPMPLPSLTIIELLTAAAAFVLILSVWMALVVLWSARRSKKRRQVEERLGILKESEGKTRVLNLWREEGRATTVVPGAMDKLPLHERLELAFNDAGLGAPVSVVLTAVGGTTVLVGVMLYAVIQNVVLACAVAVLVPIVFRFYVLIRVARKAALFERQLVDAMELAARSLRGGHPLMGAFRLVSEELNQPVSDVFHEICQQHEMGAGLEEAMRNAAAKAPTSDMKFFAASVAIQLRSGGNLADMMQRLASVIRDRMRIARRVRVLTAQTQLSKRVLIGLPIVLFLFLNIIASDYMNTFYTTTAGNIMLGICAGALLIGGWIMNRMVVLSY